MISTPMSLPPQEFGSYRILAPLGAGGMGEVYLADDVRLHRRVALKLLPGGGEDDHARKRLLREAQAAATLDHPNICTVYDVGEAHGRSFIAMQFVDGQSLSDRMARGPIPVREAVAIATQIAAALAEAHAHGVVHRDVKPQNVMIAQGGRVKVLDFGLAKLVAPAAARDATATNLTAPAAIAGTVPYMSPEQLRGEPVDARTDAFSFGVLLYELLAGVHPFAAASAAETMSAILVREPVALDTAKVPAELQRIVAKLLEKDRDRRYQSMGDVVLDLENAFGTRAPSSRRTSRRLTVVAVMAVTAIAAVATAVYVVSHRRAPRVSAAEFVPLTDFPDSLEAPALSPDGKTVAFIRGGWFLSTGDIYVKALPDGDAVQLTHDPRLKYGPAFSPDGSRVTYTASYDSGGSLNWDTWSVSIAGGPPVRLLANAAGLTWLDDSQVLYSSVEGNGLHMGLMAAAPDRRGERRVYFPPHERAMVHFSYPSPDRRWILLVMMGGTGEWQRCRLIPFDGHDAGRDIGPEGACLGAGWSPDGGTMYFNAEVSGATHLWQQRFPDGAPEPITIGATTQELGLAVAPDGRSLITAVGTRQSSPWLHSPAGDRIAPIEGIASDVHLSLDGARVYCLLSKTANAPQILTRIDLPSGRADRLLAAFSMKDFDISADEQTIVFTSARGERREIWIASPDGQFTPRQLVDSGDQPHLTSDGGVLFRALGERDNHLDRVGRDGGGRRRVVAAPIIEVHGVSPDGRWASVDAAFGAVHSAPQTHLIETLTGVATRICENGCRIRWAVDGRHLYVSGNPNASMGQTFAIPLPPGVGIPGSAALDAAASWTKRPGVVTIPEPWIAPTADPASYLFYRVSRVSNLFRVPLR